MEDVLNLWSEWEDNFRDGTANFDGRTDALVGGVYLGFGDE